MLNTTPPLVGIFPISETRFKTPLKPFWHFSEPLEPGVVWPQSGRRRHLLPQASKQTPTSKATAISKIRPPDAAQPQLISVRRGQIFYFYNSSHLQTITIGSYCKQEIIGMCRNSKKKKKNGCSWVARILTGYWCTTDQTSPSVFMRQRGPRRRHGGPGGVPRSHVFDSVALKFLLLSIAFNR